MTERRDVGGGLTGATGELTPESTDQAFVSGEHREMTGAAERGRVTHNQARQAPAQTGGVGEPGLELAEGGPTNLAEREGGYASVHGLSPDDPAYRMEEHAPAPAVVRGEPGTPERSEARIGGDEISDRQERL